MAPHDHEEDISIDDAPTTINPYTVLGVPEDATPAQIKTAYRKAALKHHPDKATTDSEKSAAHTKFQEIAFANAILSDERRRALLAKDQSARVAFAARRCWGCSCSG